MKKQIFASLLGASALLPNAAVANMPTFPHIEIVGTGEIQVMPDMAHLDISVTVVKSTAEEAKQASDQAVTALLSRLDQMQIDRKDIESANLSLQPKYSYPKIGEPNFLGYQAVRQVEVTIRDLLLLNKVLDGALTDGLNKINGIAFASSKQDEIQEKARSAAVEDAKRKAKSLAAGFGRELAGVWQVRYGNISSPRPMMRAMMASNDVESSYVESAITISDRVEVIFILNQ